MATYRNGRKQKGKGANTKKPSPPANGSKPSPLVPRLPKEAHYNILSNLPVRSLLRFRCVSKAWLSIIDDFSFAESHLARSPARFGGCRLLLSFPNPDHSRHLLYSSTLQSAPAQRCYSLPGCAKESAARCLCSVSAAVNGLFCFSNGREAFVCNPSTLFKLTLPPYPFSPTTKKKSNNTSSSKSKSKRYVASDPSLNPPFSHYSIAFDSAKNAFKVLNVRGVGSSTGTKVLQDLKCVIFDLCADLRRQSKLSWREISAVPPYPYPLRGNGVFVNGSLHWMCPSGAGKEVLVAFDVSSERFRLVPLPPEFDTLPFRSTAGDAGGRLALIPSSRDRDSPAMEFWVLEDYEKNSWVRRTVTLPSYLKPASSPIPVGNACTGDLFLMRHASSAQSCSIVRHSSATKGAAVRRIQVTGLPAWAEWPDERAVNVCVTNYLESFWPFGESKALAQEDTLPN